MDPNATLTAILEGNDDFEDMIFALRSWIANYGFAPEVELPDSRSAAFARLPSGTLTANRHGIHLVGSSTLLLNWTEVLEALQDEREELQMQ